jgi:hypothetical protein
MCDIGGVETEAEKFTKRTLDVENPIETEIVERTCETEIVDKKIVAEHSKECTVVKSTERSKECTVVKSTEYPTDKLAKAISLWLDTMKPKISNPPPSPNNGDIHTLASAFKNWIKSVEGTGEN